MRLARADGRRGARLSSGGGFRGVLRARRGAGARRGSVSARPHPRPRDRPGEFPKQRREGPYGPNKLVSREKGALTSDPSSDVNGEAEEGPGPGRE